MTGLVYDGTWYGLLSALFEAYGIEDAVIRDGFSGDTPSLFDWRTVESDDEKARRLTKGMERLGAEVPLIAYRGFHAERQGYEDDLLLSLRLGFELGSDPFTQRQHPYVYRVCSDERRAGSEAHRMLGLVRFAQVNDGLYVGDIEPDCNILPLIGQHFHDRFSDQRLILRDLRRKTAVISDPKEGGWQLVQLTADEITVLPRTENFEDMWRSYFTAIAQQERINSKLQRQFVPLKYRKHLPEFVVKDRF